MAELGEKEKGGVILPANYAHLSVKAELGQIVECPVCGDETRKDYPNGYYCSSSCQREESLA